MFKNNIYKRAISNIIDNANTVHEPLIRLLFGLISLHTKKREA